MKIPMAQHPEGNIYEREISVGKNVSKKYYASKRFSSLTNAEEAQMTAKNTATNISDLPNCS